MPTEQIPPQLTGNGAKLDDSQFDPEMLELGTHIEMEHTFDSDIAKSIAKDHLVEDADYYIKLLMFVEPEKLNMISELVTKVPKIREFKFEESLEAWESVFDQDERERSFKEASSFVGRVTYSIDNRTLEVELNGKEYGFCGVPESKFDSFEGAPSKGAFFNREIKEQFDCGKTAELSQFVKEQMEVLRSCTSCTKKGLELLVGNVQFQATESVAQEKQNLMEVHGVLAYSGVSHNKRLYLPEELAQGDGQKVPILFNHGSPAGLEVEMIRLPEDIQTRIENFEKIQVGEATLRWDPDMLTLFYDGTVTNEFFIEEIKKGKLAVSLGMVFEDESDPVCDVECYTVVRSGRFEEMSLVYSPGFPLATIKAREMRLKKQSAEINTQIGQQITENRMNFSEEFTESASEFWNNAAKEQRNSLAKTLGITVKETYEELTYDEKGAVEAFFQQWMKDQKSSGKTVGMSKENITVLDDAAIGKWWEVLPKSQRTLIADKLRFSGLELIPYSGMKEQPKKLVKEVFKLLTKDVKEGFVEDQTTRTDNPETGASAVKFEDNSKHILTDDLPINNPQVKLVETDEAEGPGTAKNINIQTPDPTTGS